MPSLLLNVMRKRRQILLQIFPIFEPTEANGTAGLLESDSKIIPRFLLDLAPKQID